MFRKLSIVFVLACSLRAADEPKPPVVSVELQRDAYKTLAALAAVNLQIAEATLKQQEAKQAFDAAKAALMNACGADFQMDQETLKQEKFVCIAKPKANAIPAEKP